MSKISFAICEQSYLIRAGLASVIEKIPDTKLIQEIENEEELIAYADRCEADFLIINKNFLQNPDLLKTIIFLSGITGLIILLDNSNIEIPEINHAGIIHIDDLQSKLLKKFKEITGSNSVARKDSIPEEISNREADILKNIALGFSNKEIADKLFISAHTVVTHRKNITRKLGIKTAPGLTIYAIINNLIDINEAG